LLRWCVASMVILLSMLAPWKCACSAGSSSPRRHRQAAVKPSRYLEWFTRNEKTSLDGLAFTTWTFPRSEHEFVQDQALNGIVHPVIRVGKGDVAEDRNGSMGTVAVVCAPADTIPTSILPLKGRRHQQHPLPGCEICEAPQPECAAVHTWPRGPQTLGPPDGFAVSGALDPDQHVAVATRLDSLRSHPDRTPK
jgi:hypothetical protein